MANQSNKVTHIRAAEPDGCDLGDSEDDDGGCSYRGSDGIDYYH